MIHAVERMTPQDLLDLWTSLTGEKWRLVPYSVQQQATDFISGGFTREELELVVTYTRQRINRGEGGFNPQSLLWRVLAADNWQKFQERLELAQLSRKRRKAAATPAPVAPAEDYDPDKIREQIEASKAFRRTLLGGN